MDNKKRRLGEKVFHLDTEIWKQCRALGLSDKDIERVQAKLLLYGIRNTATLAAAIAIKEFKERK